MPATEVLIARHGEAHCNRDALIGGPAGCRGLTGPGRLQAERLAQRLARHPPARPIQAIYTTPLRRAHESAAIIGAYLAIDTQIVPGLAEQDHGSADGRPWTEVVAEYGGVPALDADRPLAPGGETWREYIRRSSLALARILARHDGDRILIVGHGETVVTAFHHFFGLPAASRSAVSVAVHYASLTIWEQQPISWTRPAAGMRWTLMTHNDTGHLPISPDHAPDADAGT